MCVSISASVNLGCLFAPKAYIVLFQPHKNVRHSVSGQSGGSKRGRPLFGNASRFNTLNAMNGDVTSPSNNTDSKLASFHAARASMDFVKHECDDAISCVDMSEDDPLCMNHQSGIAALHVADVDPDALGALCACSNCV